MNERQVFQRNEIDFKVSKINDIELKPIIRNKLLEDKKNIIGGELFDNPYNNTFILAKKRSGKSCTIYHILEKSVYKDSKVLFFCSTIHIDDTYRKILKLLDKKGIDYEINTSFKDEETGEDLLQGLLEELKNPNLSDSENDDDEIKEIKVLGKGNIDYGYTRTITKKKKKIEKKKPEKLYSKIFVIIDDMGKVCRHPAIGQLMKINRHSKMRIIVSSQYINDLTPEALKQLDYCLVFKSLNNDKIEKLHQDLDIGSLDNNQFSDLYKEITSEPFSFLYIDVRQEKFRKNFNISVDVIKKE